ncbi:MAG: hypothetical protein A2026_05265 [Deltaproteobacteria bacterium RBG_19FT_COMBO_46_12]|nr:MAG: hypothetical protein A2026_05265 [Deltaproteobacteria bacterium RBG_19FT_COMBO_46_12]
MSVADEMKKESSPSILSFKTERSFGTFPNHRRYKNMFSNNFLISIFSVRLTFHQDKSCPEMGKMT